MKRILLTALLIVTANTVSATNLSIVHDKKLPTPYELLTKGEVLDKQVDVEGMVYYIAWDKTDDLYACYLPLAHCKLLRQSSRRVSNSP